MSLKLKQRGLYRTRDNSYVMVTFKRAGKNHFLITYHNIVTGDVYWQHTSKPRTQRYFDGLTYCGAVVKCATPDRSQWELAA